MKTMILTAVYVVCGFELFAADDAAFEDASVLFAGVEGLELRELGSGKLQLKGQIYRKSDLRKVQDFLKRNPEVENRTRLSKEIAAIPSDQKVVGQSSASILLELILVEVKKSALQKLGSRFSSSINLGAQANFKFLSTPSDQASIATMDPIRSFLDIAIQKGEAKIHAKQSVVTQNGKEGEFQAGGEFPIKMSTQHSTKIEYKPFGLFLKFTPNLQRAPDVHLAIHSEVSEVDMGSQVDGLPMILKKDLKTQVVARLGEMMALGGVIRSSQSKFFDEMPGLSEVPVLGRLFRSEDFRNQKSEAYIFVTVRKMEAPWLPTPDL